MYDEDSDELFAGARSRNIWLRGLLMLLFLAVLWFIRLIVLILAAFQFVFAIVTGGPNQRLLPFGRSVAAYMQQMAAFVTWTTETRPFPFSPWPADGATSPDDPMTDTPPAPSGDWDEPFEPDAAYEAPPPEPMEDEPPAEPAAEEASPEPITDEPPDEPPAPPEPKPRASDTRAKKKKKGSRQQAAPEDADPAGDEFPGDS